MRTTGHIRQRSEGSWEIRYSLGQSPATGKRRVATVTVRGTRREAEQELRRLLRTIDTGEHVDPTRLKVAQWLSQWCEAIRHEISPKSHERYTELVENFLGPELGSIAIAKLAPSHIQAAYAKWATGGRRDGKGGGLSASTRRYLHRILYSALARAVEQQLIARNPAEAFRKRLPKVERKEFETLSAAQSARLLVALSGRRLYWPVMIALATGMRRGEILALRWRNVDLERAEIRVMESLEQTKKGLRFKPPKSDKSRTIALPAFIIDGLRKYRISQAQNLLAIGVRQSPDTLVCCAPDGSPVQPRSLTHAFSKEMLLVPDVPRIRFHDLRHTHATQLLLAGVHPKVAQERLGHSTISTTLDLYSHVTETMQQDAAARMDATLGSAISAPLG
jgi:integrase